MYLRDLMNPLFIKLKSGEAKGLHRFKPVLFRRRNLYLRTIKGREAEVTLPKES